MILTVPQWSHPVPHLRRPSTAPFSHCQSVSHTPSFSLVLTGPPTVGTPCGCTYAPLNTTNATSAAPAAANAPIPASESSFVKVVVVGNDRDGLNVGGGVLGWMGWDFGALYNFLSCQCKLGLAHASAPHACNTPRMAYAYCAAPYMFFSMHPPPCRRML